MQGSLYGGLVASLMVLTAGVTGSFICWRRRRMRSRSRDESEDVPMRLMIVTWSRDCIGKHAN